LPICKMYSLFLQPTASIDKTLRLTSGAACSAS
jgi:hypothetical protein